MITLMTMRFALFWGAPPSRPESEPENGGSHGGALASQDRGLLAEGLLRDGHLHGPPRPAGRRLHVRDPRALLHADAPRGGLRAHRQHAADVPRVPRVLHAPRLPLERVHPQGFREVPLGGRPRRKNNTT